MKIIAIRPRENCDTSYSKNLILNETYYFYNNFTIDGDSLLVEPGLPDDFYQKEQPLINISAIVGKNGSGKSTLIELMLRAINNIAFSQKIVLADLEYVKGLHLELYFQTDNYYKIEMDDESIIYKHYDGRSKKFVPSADSLPLQRFFYTITVNYSHYAYNIKEMKSEGNWLEGLFRKNDGYQSPLVLNPYRTDGVIDINTESELLKSRLLANLLRSPQKQQNYFHSLTPLLEADALKLTLKDSMEEAIMYNVKAKDGSIKKIKFEEIYTPIQRHELLTRINGVFRFGYRGLTNDEKEEYKIALDYIAYKVVAIGMSYFDKTDRFFIKESQSFTMGTEKNFLIELNKDRSHITLKLRQTLNYMRYNRRSFKTDEPMSLSGLAKRNTEIMKTSKKLEGVELIPPPIFITEVIMREKANHSKKIPFHYLSSGEKQLIYSTNSLLYHLYNLNSVQRSSYKRTAYNYVNIILEEVELYAHPEMQRTYINEILRAMKEIGLNENTELNFIFVTHSPFILSDIPDNNILFLEQNGSPLPQNKRMKTFGGNIHDLLAHSFFLNDGAIGDFALNKIQTIIEQLNEEHPNKNLAIKKEGDPVLLAEIKLIGEDFLREKLLDMYYFKYDKKTRIDELEAELKQLKA